MTSLAGITYRDPDVLSGVPVFVGTRVPVRSLFDYLEGGDSLEEFLHQFPSVKRERGNLPTGTAPHAVPFLFAPT